MKGWRLASAQSIHGVQIDRGFLGLNRPFLTRFQPHIYKGAPRPCSMTTLYDSSTGPKPRPRHPEKVHRPDTAVRQKPDWIRVKAPVSPGFRTTQAIVREHGLH